MIADSGRDIEAGENTHKCTADATGMQTFHDDDTQTCF